MAEHDSLGDEGFCAKYDVEMPNRLVLTDGRRAYDCTAIFSAAHRLVTGDPRSITVVESSRAEAKIIEIFASYGLDVMDLRAALKPEDQSRFGEVPGFSEGSTFSRRKDAHAAGVHRAGQDGIVGRAKIGAESIVLSGGYEDDIDLGDEILYTGRGGQDERKKQVDDQSFSDHKNAALLVSMIRKLPVRVIRGARHKSPFSPASGYRYDGLFRVVDAWREGGKDGFQICRYLLKKIDVSSPAGSEVSSGADESPSLPSGNKRPSRRRVAQDRIVRSTEVAEFIKNIYDCTCQICGTRLSVGDRGYAEGAHIKPLGSRHKGPDTVPNILCLCPNCHVLFDFGALRIADDLTVLGGGGELSLRRHEVHFIDREFLAYHRSIFSQK